MFLKLIGLFFLLLILGLFYMFKLPGVSFKGEIPPPTTNEEHLSEALGKSINVLASAIGERNLFKEGSLDSAADFIERTLKNSSPKIYSQFYTVNGKTVRNIVAEYPGQGEEIVVVGAHYDTVMGSPGADDNASGVATLLELAKLLKNKPNKRIIRLVFFVNEEPPFFQTENMGSLKYAEDLKRRGEKIFAMLSLESIGFYTTSKNSQKYPFPLNYFYPNTGDFIGFVANLSSHKLLNKTVGAFRKNTAFPSEGLAAPAGMVGVGWSDQWSFWQQGFEAVMVTGTALFRNPHYHLFSDTPEKIDYNKLARVTVGLFHVIDELSNTN